MLIVLAYLFMLVIMNNLCLLTVHVCYFFSKAWCSEENIDRPRQRICKRGWQITNLVLLQVVCVCVCVCESLSHCLNGVEYHCR